MRTQETKRGSSSDVPHSVFNVVRSPGRALDRATRARMEPRFGFDFSDVRVHSDRAAHDAVRDAGALAWTYGRDVAFGADQYRPGTRDGDSLIAHELAHVVQQHGSAPLLQRRTPDGDDTHEGMAASLRKQYGLGSEDEGGPSDAEIKYRLLQPKEDLDRIRIAPVSDFLVSDLTSSQSVGVTVTDSGVKSIEWELQGPGGKKLPGAIKTAAGTVDATKKPFTLKPSQFNSAAGFKPGRHFLTCRGLNAQGLITVTATRDFNVLDSDLTTGTAVTGTYGEMKFTTYEKIDATSPGGTYSIRAWLDFLPKSTVDCNDVIFLQAAQALDPSGKSLLPQVGPEITERSTPMAWTIDQTEQQRSPYYITETDPATKAIRDDPGLGKVGHGGTTPGSTTLGDRPTANQAATYHFESCAICRSGTKSGSVFGCATWGYSADAAGKVKLMPRSVSDSPSWIFRSAGESWNRWNKDKPATPARVAVPELK